MQKIEVIQLEQKKIELLRKQQELNIRQKELSTRQALLLNKQTQNITHNTYHQHNNIDNSFFNQSQIQADQPKSLSDSNCMSLAQLHLVLSESEDIGIQKNLATIQRLAKDILSQIKQPCESAVTLIELAKQVCLDNLRLVQQLLNTNESNQVLQDRIAQFNHMMQDTKQKQERMNKQTESLRKILRQTQKDKQQLLKKLKELEKVPKERPSIIDHLITQKPPNLGLNNLTVKINRDTLSSIDCKNNVSSSQCQNNPNSSKLVTTQKDNGTTEKLSINFFKDRPQTPRLRALLNTGSINTVNQIRDSTAEKNNKPLFTLKSKVRAVQL